jgi:hypothetical protein
MPTIHPRRATAKVAVAATALLIAASAGQARPVHDSSAARTSAIPTSAVPAPSSTPTILRDSGFDWSDAAVGAAGAGGFCALLGAGALMSRRTRRVAEPPLGAR